MEILRVNYLAVFVVFQISLAKKGAGQQNSRIPLPTGRYFLNLSPTDVPPPRTPITNNLRQQQRSAGNRRPNMERSLPLESPTSHHTLTPRDALASIRTGDRSGDRSGDRTGDRGSAGDR